MVEMEGGRQGYLVDATDYSFALKCSDQLGENDTVPQAFFHLDDTKAEFLAETTLYPLLGLADVTQILVGLEEMPLGICPEAPCQTGGGQGGSIFWGGVSGQTEATRYAGDVIGLSKPRCNAVGGEGWFTNMVTSLLWSGVDYWWRCLFVLVWGVIAVSTGYTGKMATKLAGTDLTIGGSLFVGHVRAFIGSGGHDGRRGGRGRIRAVGGGGKSVGKIETGGCTMTKLVRWRWWGGIERGGPAMKSGRRGSGGEQASGCGG